MRKAITHNFIISILVIIVFTSCKKNINPPTPQPQLQPQPQPPVKLIDSVETVYVTGGRTKEFFAFDGKDGSLKWKLTLGDYATFSPVYSNGKIITEAADTLYAFDTSGKLSWKVTLNSSVACAPILNNGIIYISDTSNIYAFNSNTGLLIWKFSEGGAGRLIFNKGTIYCHSINDYLYAINADNGIKKWQYNSGGIGQPPVVVNDSVYYLAGGWTMQVLSASTGTLLWSGGDPSVYDEMDVCSYNVNYGKLYVVNNGLRSGIDAMNTHNPLELQFAYRSNVFTSNATLPILADSLAIIPSAVIDARTCTDLNIYNLPGNATSGVTYLNGIVYCVTREKDFYDPYTGGYTYADVFAYDIKANKFLWKNSLKGCDFVGVEPCIVTRSGTAYVAGVAFK